MPKPPFPPVIDNTILSAYRKCAKRAEYEFFWNKVADDTNVHLHAGGAFAKGLEVVRKEFFISKRPFDEALALGGLALIKAYGDFIPRDDHSNKSLPMLLGALGYYFDRWPIDQGLVPAEIGGKPAIEFSFAVPFPKVLHPESGEPIIICGRFDMIASFNGTLLGEDDKTASQLGKTWLDRWRVSNQITTYCWGASQYGIPLSGFNMRGVGLYKARYDGVDAITYRRAWQLAEWERNTEATLRDMIRDWERGYFAYNWADACSAFGGCPYLLLCESAEPAAWLPVHFKDRTWDPLGSRE